MRDNGNPRFDEHGVKIRSALSPIYDGTRKAGPPGNPPRWREGVVARMQAIERACGYDYRTCGGDEIGLARDVIDPAPPPRPHASGGDEVYEYVSPRRPPPRKRVTVGGTLYEWCDDGRLQEVA